MQVAANKVVGIHYTLTNNEGQVLDSSQGGNPLYYLHGHSNIIPGLEKQLEGCTTGDAFEVTVEPSEGYGERDDNLVQQVQREAFQGVDSIEPGMQFQTQGPGGTMVVTVVDANDQVVTIDANHPLAGVALNFKGSVESVRDASDEEVQHGHAHEGDMHHH
ncbi:FKBP-type peptidyl-prolyl cis-trans isomerase [Marinospirillum alkaliphilum]|uniref:Peptidyl-prolyl cis-trans isomerase n=1 Tax=Marinospirillum alkaliphilum DSM 21637 TaxID=1122209 RepID=A0A1K1UDQ9_9GAMM|nr:peptidylprolyl isomerase [Marinospirillum alkaliphilum]SFX10944.1 FKBP-type peptidyl-prolyl cis-trans isomerase SlyD [Marinospirillum alkaliphilum DSM 21637]